ncbi:G-alpha-domain-containing protein [Dendrothele bispora CBS 962.96]|uniref:G-alpha-domain-containing protein n=1 Tax=Dendrothele bispora (strain CBS 962.96) TaxID=1314807 RepID=A0A4V4HG01_DENBC|nr:G-alpha-domain-containing protein [Dendrothele bispora CBS 962.96]
MSKEQNNYYVDRRRFSDPLAAALQPPPGETPDQKAARVKREDEARKRSDHIDEMIRQDKLERKKTKAEVSVLLLGQSESGKSTTLKQFQLLHSPSAFHAERIAWRAVIYLNLVKSIRRILEALPLEDDEEEHDEDSLETATVIISARGRPPSAITGTRVPNYEDYRQRLEPLAELEERLTRLLSCPEEEDPVRLPPSSRSNGYNVTPNGDILVTNGRPTPTILIPDRNQSQSLPVSPLNGHGSSPTSQPSSQPSPIGSGSSSRSKEVAVHTSTNWKKAFSLGSRSKSPKTPHSGEIEGWWEDPDDPVHALNACAPAMQDLWRDPLVKKRLQEKKIRLEESSGFYLDEIYRITAKKYIPTDADVLKARLKTLGVVEHSFIIPSGNNKGARWKIYDVGGARNQRHAWAPYFEDVNAIIFLAPISAFDQVLTEDAQVNRLEDSLLLWKDVVSHKLLAKVNLVLFLNKIDLLQAKLEAGVRLNQHMISYGDRPNDFESIAKYFKSKFWNIHYASTPNKDRELYIHLTSVTDTRRTAIIIADVRDSIIKTNLRDLRLV